MHADPHETCGQPGSRAPHLWIEKDGKPISTLDLFGDGFALLAAPGGETWSVAARNAAKDLGLALDAYTFGHELRDPENRFTGAYGLKAGGAALIRPDGFVAWRSGPAGGNAREVLKRTLTRLLCRNEA
jgi:hypothetical protein